MSNPSEKGPSSRDLYDDTLSGAQDRPFVPRLKSDSTPYHPLPHSLVEFREQEGRANRKARLRELWLRLPPLEPHSPEHEDPNASGSSIVKDYASLTPERAKKIRNMYEQELAGSCGNETPGRIPWKQFVAYAQDKEVGEYVTLALSSEKIYLTLFRALEGISR